MKKFLLAASLTILNLVSFAQIPQGYPIYTGAVTKETIPKTNDDIKLLNTEIIGKITDTYILKTGNINSTFVILIPTFYDIFSIRDQMAGYIDVSGLFELTPSPDISNAYKMYVMSNAIPYGDNHNYEIQLTNAKVVTGTEGGTAEENSHFEIVNIQGVSLAKKVTNRTLPNLPAGVYVQVWENGIKQKMIY